MRGFGAHHSAKPTPVIDPRSYTGGNPPSAFRLLRIRRSGQEPAHRRVKRVGLPILIVLDQNRRTGYALLTRSIRIVTRGTGLHSEIPALDKTAARLLLLNSTLTVVHPPDLSLHRSTNRRPPSPVTHLKSNG